MANTTIGGITVSSTVAADDDLREIEQGGVSKKEANSTLKTYMINPTVNKQTGTAYTVANTDNGKLVTQSNAASSTYTLPVATTFINGWWTSIQNVGAGTLTITPTTSTIDGVSSLVLLQNQGCRIVSDGTNYYTQRGGAGNTADSTKSVLSATKLTTARTINGTSFDGTTDITIADDTKEPAITADLVTKFWSGTKTWRDLATDVRAAVLTGLSTATGTVISATDTVLSALGSLQNQVSANTANASSFNKSTWSFSDFDQSAGGVFVAAVNSGTVTYGADIADTYGNALVKSSTSANSGGYVGVSQTTAPRVGMVTRTVFTIQSAQSTRTLRGGYVSSGGYLATETNGIYWNIVDQVATAWTSNASTTTSQGSATLPLNIPLYCDTELLTSSSARIVIFDPSTNTIYLDQRITTNIPTAAMYTISKATSSGTAVVDLCLFDYYGRGRSRPSYIIAPPYGVNIG